MATPDFTACFESAINSPKIIPGNSKRLPLEEPSEDHAVTAEENASERLDGGLPVWCSRFASFPLTPALSLRERETVGQFCAKSNRPVFADALPTILPLLRGEGRGEGRGTIRVSLGSLRP